FFKISEEVRMSDTDGARYRVRTCDPYRVNVPRAWNETTADQHHNLYSLIVSP
ncbi:MAG: hypothetical protein QOF72_2793, partial [Blastocatellia bacterium]|nr:hypothetical protein [Blastocatellia bacterium]